mmetsp:Transcript_40690/g.65489  ORF Transcript_40690/g.65489 Transcript_40690/m.65489 type:complete len:121 (+) Transcript_40690:148-510(+)
MRGKAEKRGGRERARENTRAPNTNCHDTPPFNKAAEPPFQTQPSCISSTALSILARTNNHSRSRKISTADPAQSFKYLMLWCLLCSFPPCRPIFLFPGLFENTYKGPTTLNHLNDRFLEL